MLGSRTLALSHIFFYSAPSLFVSVQWAFNPRMVPVLPGLPAAPPWEGGEQPAAARLPLRGARAARIVTPRGRLGGNWWLANSTGG